MMRNNPQRMSGIEVKWGLIFSMTRNDPPKQYSIRELKPCREIILSECLELKSNGTESLVFKTKKGQIEFPFLK